MKKIGLIVVIVSLCISMTGCVYSIFFNGEDVYTAGDRSTHSAQTGLCIMVQSSKKSFDISDVTMDLYCGLYNVKNSEVYGVDFELSSYAIDLQSEALFSIYICDTDENESLYMFGEYEDYTSIDKYYYVRTISYEEAKKEEYGYTTSITGSITYNHCESLKIPQEFFEENEGSLEIVISSFMEPTREKPYYVAYLMQRIKLKFEKTEAGKVVITNMKKE